MQKTHYKVPFFLLGLLITHISCSKMDRTTKLYIDKSNEIEYVSEYEIPNLNSQWSIDDLNTAIVSIKNIASKGKEFLPRYKSEWSGPIFQKMINNGSLDIEDSSNLDLESYLDIYDKNIEFCDVLFNCYYKIDTRNQPFSPEALLANLYLSSLFEVYYTIPENFKQEIYELTNTSELLTFIESTKKKNLNYLSDAVSFSLQKQAFREEDIIMYLEGLNNLINKYLVHLDSKEKNKLKEAYVNAQKETDSQKIQEQISILLNKLD